MSDDWVVAIGPCFCCQRQFEFNPHKVPSINLGDGRKPVCRPCMDKVNVIRAQDGKPPHPILDGAYSPMPATEL